VSSAGVMQQLSLLSKKGGQTWLVNEDFETTGDPDGAGSGWTSTGTVDWDEGTTVLRGSQSLKINANYSSASANFAAQSTVNCFFRFRMSNLPVSNITVGLLYDGSNTVSSLRVISDGTMRVYNGTAYGATSAGAIAANTTYYIWVSYTAGNGTNGVSAVTIETTPTKGAADASTSVGTATANAIEFRLSKDSADGYTHYYDQILISPTEIGNVPN